MISLGAVGLAPDFVLPLARAGRLRRRRLRLGFGWQFFDLLDSLILKNEVGRYAVRLRSLTRTLPRQPPMKDRAQELDYGN